MIAVGDDAVMPRGARNARCARAACAAWRDRCARAFPRSGLSAQGRFRQRHGGGGLRRRHHRVRHAEHHSADRHAGRSRRQAPHGGCKGARRFRALWFARRRHDRACPRVGQERDRLQALHGQHLRQDRVAVDRCDARSLRSGGADRQARFTARRDEFDHGAPRDSAAGGRPRSIRSHTSHRGPPWSRSRRSAAPRYSPNGPAHAFISCISPRPKNCGRCARPRRAASISPAKPARIMSCSRPTTTRDLPASSGSIRRCARRAISSRSGTRLPTARSM